MLLTHRKLLQSKAIAIENDLRGTLRNFGLKRTWLHHRPGSIATGFRSLARRKIAMFFDL
jgi:hypothetical protein